MRPSLSAWLLVAGAVGVGTWLLLLHRDPLPAAQTVSPSLKLAAKPDLAEAELRESAGPSSEYSAPANKDDFDNSPTTGVRTDHEFDDPKTVIGRPFPISESVKAVCRREEEDGLCLEALKVLAQMAEEPRDARWAAATETCLREWLSQSGEFTIRSVECRTKWCAIEVTSLYGPYPGIRSGDPLDGKLSNWGPMFGYETNPSSTRVTVTVFMFKRI